MKLLKKLLVNQRGMILVISLLILALLIGAGVGAIVSMQTDFRTSGNLKTATQAFYNADAGINHARQELQDGDGTKDFSSVFNGADSANDTVIVSNSSFNGGTYSVTRKGSNTNPDRVKVLSVGTAPNNARAELEVWFKKDTGRPPKAVETDGDLKINGNPNIMGTCGAAHSNQDMQISGNPGIQMADGLTASNKTTNDGGLADGMDISGNPCVGSSQCSLPSGQQPDANKLDTNTKKDNYEAAHNSASQVTIPTINPADYAPKVAAMGANHYILNNNGTVTTGGTCGTDGLCSGGTAVAIPSGWSFSGDTWKVSGSTAANGVFYSEGKIDVSGSPGTDASPWQATIIARDSIKISGSPDIKPYPTSSTDLQNHLFVTGNDLEISGNMEADYAKGAILVHQQVKINGNPEITGFIIAGDGQPTWTGDPFTNSSSGITVNEISGNPTITYSCDFGCTGPGCPPPTVGTASWAQKF